MIATITTNNKNISFTPQWLYSGSIPLEGTKIFNNSNKILTIMKNLTFEVHTYSPQQNKIFLNGVNVTSLFPFCLVDETTLTKNYRSNLQKVRKAINYPTYNHFVIAKYISLSGKFPKAVGGNFNSWSDAKKGLDKVKNWYSEGCKVTYSFTR